MEPLDADSIFGTFGDRSVLVGEHGEVLGTVRSTMDVARERLVGGVPDGYAVLAEQQTAGRGREGGWECPPGLGILMTVVLQIRLSRAEQNQITMMGAVAGAEAFGSVGVPARIKWPNDIVVAAKNGGPVQKLGGVLVERVKTDDAAAPFLLGMGLNVNQRRQDLPADTPLPATSMRLVKGRPFDRTRVCRALLREVDRWYRRLRMGQPERIMARWRRLSCLLNRHVRVRTEGRLLRGTVLGLRSTGELIFRRDGGEKMILSEERTKLVL